MDATNNAGIMMRIQLIYLCICTYLCTPYIAHLPTYSTYHPRYLELRNCLKVRWQEGAMD